MKKILLLIVLSFFSTQGFTASCPDGSEPQKTVSADGTYFVYKCAADSNDAQSKTQSSHKLDDPRNWPSGIKYAREASANAILYFDEAVKPERLYINSHDRPPHNVAYQGNIETPNSYYGFWPKGAYSKYSPYRDFYLDKFIFEEGIDDIVDGNDHVQRAFDVENKEVFSFHLQNFHNGNKDSLETLKSMMLEWVNGPYWEAMIPDRQLACTTCSNEQPIWEGYNFSILGELWNTLIPMLEVHITLIREEAYSTAEYDLVHKWLEKRVWLAEQGPAEGQLASAHRWMPDPGPPNHHKIRKTLGYLMWGIADQNSEYFTAGVRGVDAYHNVLRNDGSITTEHFHDKACQTGFGDHGCRSGLSLGNETGKFYALAAIAMHNQGIDVRKKYPKIERNIEWTTQVAVDPTLAMKWIGNIFVASRVGTAGETFSKEGIVMDWARNWSPIRKNLSHIFLWDKVFQTNYADNLKSVVVIDLGKEEEQIYDHIVRRAFDSGMADTGLITFNPDEVVTGLTLDKALDGITTTQTAEKKAVESVVSSPLFDGQYTFRLYRYGEEGTMGLGGGLIKIKNGEMIVEKDKRGLSTGPKDLYDTFEGQIDENGQVYGSIELDILGGKDRSEVYYLNGPIKEIWGESPDECCLKVYFTLKPIKEAVTSSAKVSTSDGDPTVSKIIEVIQGDRFIVDIAEPHELAGSNIKLFLRDIDAPDTVKSCTKEIELGTKVKDIVTEKLADATSIKLKNFKKTYKGVLAQVIVDGKDLGEELIAKDYASDESGYWKAYICSAGKAYSAGEQYLWADDFEKAIFWLERALVMDPDHNRSSGATYGLSSAYKQQGIDVVKARDYLKKAATLGVMNAELELGENYLNGWDGFEKDSSEGKYWLKKAHEHGSKDAEDICGCKF